MGSRRFLLALLALAFATTRLSEAATRVVPDAFPTVQSALDAAVSGDTVFVRAGTYNESLSLAGKDVLVLGETDGTVLTTASTGRVLDVGGGVTAATSFEKLIVRAGLATFGAGIELHNGASPTIRFCRLLDNRAQISSGSAYGAALWVGPGSVARLDSCSFASNFANSATLDLCFGGAVFVSGTGEMIAERCHFESNVAAGFEGGAGGAVSADADAEITLRDCLFAGNAAGLGGAIQSGGATIERCRFERNSGAYGAAAVQISRNLEPVSIVDNVFVDNESIGSMALEVLGTGEVRGNTIAFNGLETSAGGVRFGGDIAIERNIVVGNGNVGVWCTGSQPTVACNDVWNNATSNYGGSCGDLSGIDGNLSEDPLFCDSDHRDLTLMAGSSCAPSGPCGLIGALGVACSSNGITVVKSAGRSTRLLSTRPHPTTVPVTFAFELARPSKVRLEVYDLLGRRIASLGPRDFAAGTHELIWDGRGAGGAPAGSGFFVVVLEADGLRDTKRFLLTR